MTEQDWSSPPSPPPPGRDSVVGHGPHSHTVYHYVFLTSRDGVVVIDPEGLITEANPAACKLFAYPQEGLRGNTISNFLGNQYPHPATIPLTTPGDPANSVIEYRFVRSDNTPITVELNAHLLPDGKKLLFFRNIEDHKQQIQLQQTQKQESLSVLAGGIAHDFNNLLVAILGNADLTLQALPPTSQFREYLEEIRSTTQRAAELCRQLLAYSGKGRFIVDAVDLCEVVAEMSETLRNSTTKNTTLEFNYTTHPPLIEADITQLRQVIVNLVANAFEAIGNQKGAISISISVEQCTTDSLQNTWLSEALPGGQYLCLEVADTGSGMDETTLNRLFDPFFSTKFTGRGLGLAAVLGIVRGHHGTIQIKSHPDTGTTFRVYFPTVARQEKPPTAIVSPHPLSRRVILLVDDEESVRRVGQRMLEKLGYRVLSAVDGNDALEKYKKHREIACVILDLTMPQLDGVSTLFELRKLHQNVRVILSSGYREQEVISRFIREPPAGFIQKPYQFDVLATKLREVLAEN